MNNYPLLTIITTSLNRVQLLEKTLRSVLEQDYPNIEHIIIDGGSTDGTVDLLKKYEKKYTKKGYTLRWISEKDSGQAEAMNKGLRLVKGEFISILNSDDYFEKGAVKKLMNVFTESSDVDIVYGNTGIIFEDETKKKKLVSYKTFDLKDILYKGYQIPQPGCIFRKSLIDKVGGFDENLHHVAEHELFLRFLKAGAKTHHINTLVETILEHKGRKTIKDYKKSWEETKKVNFRHGGKYFSRFYILYLKNRYFNSFFKVIEKISPNLYLLIKKIFYKIT